MSDNYRARVVNPKQGESIFLVFARAVLQAWEAREQQEKPPEPPRIVLDIGNKMLRTRAYFLEQNGHMEQLNVNINESIIDMPIDFGGQGFMGSGPDIPGQATMDVDTNQPRTATDWNRMQAQGW